MNRSVVALAIAALLSACAAQQTKEAPRAAVEEKKPEVAKAAPEQPKAAPAQARAVAVDPLKDPSGPLSKRGVYFDFDEYAVRNEYQPLLEAHSKYLAGNRKVNIRIEGNTDERGSREYNLALGQRRAESVRKVMQVLGVEDRQVETVSFGEEKPRAECPNESCWKENRRADIVYRSN